MGASFAFFSDVPVMEHFIFGDEHIHRDHQSGQLCRCNSKPDAINAQDLRQDQTAASWNNMVRRNEISALVTPSPRAVKNEEP